MILGGCQPYFVPYIGYWQVINAVDIFTIGDDYNFIKGGWINRNRILRDKKVAFFNIEISHISSNKAINELFLSDQFHGESKLESLKYAYQKAPYYQNGYTLMEKVLCCEENNLAKFLENSIRCICDYLGIQTEIICSSKVPNNSAYRREYRIFDQCRFFGADTYFNAPGGKELYDYQQFKEHGLKLGFIHPGDIRYPQFSDYFVPSLSIIDVIMFNSPEQIHQMLNQYTIEWEET